MDLNTVYVRRVLSRYRKPVVVAGLATAAMLALAIVGAGYATYSTASFATDKLKTWQPGVAQTAAMLPAQASGFVEGVVLDVASGWLQQAAGLSDMTQVKSGLSCFDALGGPSPTEIVGHVQRTVTDPKLAAQLKDLTTSFGISGATVSGPAACASWILNG